MDTIYHHGVKGQKWGVRRYQNADGTWTPEGKQKYKAERKKYADEFKAKRDSVYRMRSTGAKLLTNLWQGPFANRTYSSVIASGGSVWKARGVTVVSTLLAAPVGLHLFGVGHLVASKIYEKDYVDKKQGLYKFNK